MAEYPWYKSYDPDVPRSLEPYPQITLLDIVSETTAEMPEHTFMYFKERYFTYKEASRLFEVMASALIANGVKPGDRVASMLLNTPQQLICAFGAMKAGVYMSRSTRCITRMSWCMRWPRSKPRLSLSGTCFMPVSRRCSRAQS